MNKKEKQEVKNKKREFGIMSYGILIGIISGLFASIFSTSLFEIFKSDYLRYYLLIISGIGIIGMFLMHDCVHERFESFYKAKDEDEGSKIILKCMFKKIKSIHPLLFVLIILVFILLMFKYYNI